MYIMVRKGLFKSWCKETDTACVSIEQLPGENGIKAKSPDFKLHI